MYSFMFGVAIVLPIISIAITSIASSSSPSPPSSHQPVAIRETSLLISTLDGNLYAVGQKSGLIKWQLQETPILRLPSLGNLTDKALSKSLFLPDPKDGSLYVYNGMSTNPDVDQEETQSETLEKLPFTISELVGASPCKSSDGLLYTGKKTDEWITIDANTGLKVDVLNSDTPICPSHSFDGSINGKAGPTHNNLLFLGKSEFHLSIFDLKSKEKTWTINLVDYSSSATVSIPQSAYDLLHLTSSTTGRIATIDLTNDDSNRLLWTHDFSSPIVAIYQFNDGLSPTIRRVPFSTIGGTVSPRNIAKHNPLFPSLYIGEMQNGDDVESKSIYALSTLVDITKTQIISAKKKHNLLLDGPRDVNDNRSHSRDSIREYFNVLVYGYYEFPQTAVSRLVPQLQITQTAQNHLLTSEEKQTIDQIVPSILRVNKNENNLTGSMDDDVKLIDLWYPFFGMTLGTISLVIALINLCVKRKNENKKKVESSSSTNNSITVGKINFDPKEIIGRGCSGTCVYKGLFEGKQRVAVKRVIADYFVLADREIELLRSFHHPHLIRYFATESDEMFRYIAIELAETTLADYIERRDEFDMNEIDLLEQSCKGLSHLHSLNVIHRDIKPQNILISLPLPPSNKRKVMITDFGVSKVLTTDNSMSLTEMSATVKGTEGWIAPEVLRAKMERKPLKPSKPIDIFSLGCLFYYMFTNGEHPFGDLLHRQANILSGQNDIEKMKKEISMCKYSIIHAMISHEPNNRPVIEAVLKHPLFWDESKSLQFLQDVSDRIEKEPVDSPVVLSLERGKWDVTKGNWKSQISVELQADLKKFRSYKENSVRDLLRAMRNKRHHYRELPEEVQLSLGTIPEQFVTYFTSRFPRLLIHAYIAMQLCRDEDVFKCYFHTSDSDKHNANNISSENKENDIFRYEPLPYSGIKWYLKKSNNENFTPNGESLVNQADGEFVSSLAGDNWKSCKRKGSPIKRSDPSLVPDMSPNY